MAKIIIGIHGLGNKPSEEILEKWWNMSIVEGLNKYYNIDNQNIKFKMVYWADILYDKPLNKKITNKNSPYYLEEPYFPGLKKINHIARNTRKKVIDFIDKILEKILLNDDFSVNYSSFTNAIIHKYFKDLDTYYSDKTLNNSGKEDLAKDIIRKRLITVLEDHKKDQILLIAHSMGSIIAYDVLSLYSKKFKIDCLITIGSPLGFPIIMSKIANELKAKFADFKKLTSPESVKYNWYNFADLEDKVAIDYKLSDDFEENTVGVKVVDFEVYNDYQANKIKNPHKSFGYLRTNEVAKVIFDFVNSEDKEFKTKLIRRIFKFISEIKLKKN
ncbi:MAG: hypothetical protein JXR51_03560 [Bacteroidales bacterium]|nr:hypothetical protein [Bacteroidales bacterium]MBN2756230.1 hypothetical protein [Bacteroidales bacterium]